MSGLTVVNEIGWVKQLKEAYDRNELQDVTITELRREVELLKKRPPVLMISSTNSRMLMRSSWWFSVGLVVGMGVMFFEGYFGSY